LFQVGTEISTSVPVRITIGSVPTALVADRSKNLSFFPGRSRDIRYQLALLLGTGTSAFLSVKSEIFSF
jgi:hypothetical protein